MKILIVDDQSEHRYLLRALLEGHGYGIVEASDGLEALAELEKERFDLVITDILMPGMDGFQLCRTMRKMEEYRKIPLVYYTATYTSPKDEKFALKIGADRFILKPSDPDVLLKAIEEVIENSNRTDIDESEEEIEDKEAFRLYSERLVRKLEQKMQQVEEELKKRREIEEKLRHSKTRLTEALRIAGMGDFTWNLSTDEVTWSKPMYELLGYDEDEQLDFGKVNSRIHHPDDLPRITSWLRESVESGIEEAGPYEYRLIHADGSVIHVQTKLRVSREDNGDAAEIHGIVQDVTRKKNAEAEREKLRRELVFAHRMESVGRLANSIAHDFNNYLTVIIGMTDSLLSEMNEEDPLRKDLKEILEAGEKSAKLTRQLLTFSSRQKLNIDCIDLHSVLEGLEGMLARLVRENVEIEMNLKASSPRVNADQVRLEQVMMNLAVNARDAMQKGGILRIETSDAEAGEKHVLLAVSDNGEGIPEDVLPKIFDPYFTTKKREKGTGLGLSTVYGIINQFGGSITVDSTLDEGTVFSILLPLS